VRADQEIHTKVPLHFIGQESSPAVKLSAAVISHVMTELDVSCLPGDLPEFIEVDLSNIALGDTIHIRDIPMPAGVKAVLSADENPAVVTTSIPKEIVVEEEVVEAAAEVPASEVPAAKQAETPAAPAEETKKEKGEKK
jgi:large subunit ribosomal protein L25